MSEIPQLFFNQKKSQGDQDSPSNLLTNMARRQSVAPPKQDARILLPKERRNQVDQVKIDGVMKELIQKQEKSLQAWTSRWDFMRNPRKYWEEEARRRGLDQAIFNRANERRQPMEWDDSRRPVAPLQPCDDLPVLSSGMIGWRAANNQNHLDLIAGPLFVSPTRTMDPPRGPNEPDLKNQNAIFLG